MAAGRADKSGVIVSCPSCGRANRLAFPTLSRTTRCGQCKSSLGPPAAPVEIADSAVFDAAASTSAIPLIVDFWAAWCAPCRMVAPEIERVARDAAGQFLVVKVDTDHLTEIAARYRIRSIPTLAVLFHGQELDRTAGVRSAADILAFAQRAVSDNQRRAS